MKIVIPKQVEVADIETPAYYKEYGVYTCITDYTVFTVSQRSVFTTAVDSEYFKQKVQSALSIGKKITQKEFEEKFFDAIKCLTEQYQSTTAMNLSYIDPKEGQQDEQVAEGATGDTQATEEATGNGEGE